MEKTFNELLKDENYFSIYATALDLEKIMRFRTRRNFEGESVATHLLGCALVCAEYVLNDKNMSDTEKLNNILYCLIHDIGEIITGDLPLPAKKLLSKTAKAELDKIEDEHTEKLLPKTFERAKTKNYNICKAIDNFAVKSIFKYRKLEDCECGE